MMVVGKKADILILLQESKLKRAMISMRLRHYQGDIITIVEDIQGDIILVRPVDLGGLFTRNSFYLEEIEEARCLKIFNNSKLYIQFLNFKQSLRQLSSVLSHNKRVLVDIE